MVLDTGYVLTELRCVHVKYWFIIDLLVCNRIVGTICDICVFDAETRERNNSFTKCPSSSTVVVIGAAFVARVRNVVYVFLVFHVLTTGRGTLYSCRPLAVLAWAVLLTVGIERLTKRPKRWYSLRLPNSVFSLCTCAKFRKTVSDSAVLRWFNLLFIVDNNNKWHKIASSENSKIILRKPLVASEIGLCACANTAFDQIAIWDHCTRIDENWLCTRSLYSNICCVYNYIYIYL